MGRKFSSKRSRMELEEYEGQYDDLYGSYYGMLFFDYLRRTAYESSKPVSWEPFTRDQIRVHLDDGRTEIYNGQYCSIRTVFKNDHSEECISREFSINLRERMREKGLTQKSLSELAGISQPMISNYLTKERVPSLPAAIRIADVLGCSLYDLIES